MNAWIKAFRLRTLPLACSGWMIGLVLAGNEVKLDPIVAAWTLFTAFLLQILSNLANDYGDAVSGVDNERKGEARMVHTGQISRRAMKRAMILFGLLSFVSGLLLLSKSFQGDVYGTVIFFLIGVLGILAAVTYTVGKNPYGYAGFGDAFVFLFFGPVLVFGSYYLQSQRINSDIFLMALPLGCFSVGVLNVNNIRDIDTDKAAGKNSVPVRIGREKAIIYHVLLLLVGMAAALFYTLKNFQSWYDLLFIGTAIPFALNVQGLRTQPAERLDPYLRQMAISTLLFSLLFSTGQILNWFF